jgi:hypothetical protein
MLGQGGGVIAGQEVNACPQLSNIHLGMETFRPGKVFQGIVEPAVVHRGLRALEVVVPTRLDRHEQ